MARMEGSLGADVLDLLADRVQGSVRELEGALKRLLAHAAMAEREMEREAAAAIIRDLIAPSRRRVTIAEIQKRVVRHYDLKPEDMSSAKRERRVVRPRQVAMFLAKQLTVHSLPEIGRHFGGRDHTTVMYAIRRIEDLRGGDPELERDLEVLGRGLADDHPN